MLMARFGLLAVVMGVTMAFFVLIAGTAFFFHHHRSEKASAHAAEAEFQRLRARFADPRPLLDMHYRRPVNDVGGFAIVSRPTQAAWAVLMVDYRHPSGGQFIAWVE